MRYFFLLGSNPTLSLAELAAVFNDKRLSLIQTNIAILETNEVLAPNIINNIGGTVKFGLIHDELKSFNTADVLNRIIAFAKPLADAKKFFFGFSYYGKNNINLKPLAMEFKKFLKQTGISSRWVTSRDSSRAVPTLSSVIVEQNKLASERGAEIVIIPFNNKFLIGKTLSVQPFKELSFRDYGRPGRDDRSGMLPPKLAQIMINLALTSPNPLLSKEGNVLPLNKGEIKEGVNNTTILDPFCGSGTIITEAMLMGFKNIIGADISKKAIDDTKKNVEWIEKNFKFPISPPRLAVFGLPRLWLIKAGEAGNFQFLNVNAAQISKQLIPASVDAIVTEPYLGPQRGFIDINKTVKELEQLYSESLNEFKKILKPHGRVVMIWPVFNLSLRAKQSNLRDPGTALTIHPNLNGFKIINPIPETLRSNIFVKLTNRGTIIYGREQQKVWREVVVLSPL